MANTARGAGGRFVSVTNETGMKLCTGPAHEEPTLLPATDKYFYRIKTGRKCGQLTSRCRLCSNWEKLKNPGSTHGWVPIKDVWNDVNEAVNRLGVMELSRRTGLAKATLINIVTKRNAYVQKKTVRLIMLELISARRKNEHTPHPTSQHLQMKRLHRYQETCSGCGTPTSNYTDGCSVCWDRRRRRQRRNGSG